MTKNNRISQAQQEVHRRAIDEGKTPPVFVAIQANRDKTLRTLESLAPEFQRIHDEGTHSIRKTRDILNERGFKTSRGTSFNYETTRRYKQTLIDLGYLDPNP